MSGEGIAGRIQHTNVRPDATRSDIEKLLSECAEYGFNGAMLNPIWVPTAVAALEGTPVRVCTALDFPMGGATTSEVARAAAESREAGADEIDVMTKVGWLKSGTHGAYRDHLRAVVLAADGAPVKAMMEVALLEPEEVRTAVELCAESGIAYLKNSSGFDGGTATPGMVSELVRLAAGRMKVKASGGIRTEAAARSLLEAGADLLGSSASVLIVRGDSTTGGTARQTPPHY